MKVFLIGYMGSGKSTAGKKLAKILDLPFYDLDVKIASNERLSISEIFAAMGESAFRGMERQTLQQLIADEDSFVLSCGGGTPCFYDNMMEMNQAGTTVYLQMDALSLAYRLSNAKEQRPLVAGMGETELKSYITQHLAEREAYYQEAKMVVNGLGLDKRKLELLAEELLA